MTKANTGGIHLGWPNTLSSYEDSRVLILSLGPLILGMQRVKNKKPTVTKCASELLLLFFSSLPFTQHLLSLCFFCSYPLNTLAVPHPLSPSMGMLVVVMSATLDWGTRETEPSECLSGLCFPGTAEETKMVCRVPTFFLIVAMGLKIKDFISDYSSDKCNKMLNL